MKKTKVLIVSLFCNIFIFLSNFSQSNIREEKFSELKFEQGFKIREGQKFSSEFRKLALDSAPDILNRYLKCAKDKNCPEKAKPKRLWIHGPSGSGKTTVAEVFADELGLKCIVVPTSLLANEYVNSFSENFIKNILPLLDQPCVILLDEIDFALKEGNSANDPQQRLPQQVWQILDYLKTLPHVIVIGTSNTISNLPQQVETRFAGSRIYMEATDSIIFRRNILNMHFKDIAHELDDIFLKQLAEKTKEFSLRELEKIVEIAASISFGRGQAPYLITKEDVFNAIKEFKKDKSLVKQANEKPILDYEKLKTSATQGAGWTGGGLIVVLAAKRFCDYKGWDCSFLDYKK